MAIDPVQRLEQVHDLRGFEDVFGSYPQERQGEGNDVGTVLLCTQRSSIYGMYPLVEIEMGMYPLDQEILNIWFNGMYLCHHHMVQLVNLKVCIHPPPKKKTTDGYI